MYMKVGFFLNEYFDMLWRWNESYSHLFKTRINQIKYQCGFLHNAKLVKLLNLITTDTTDYYSTDRLLRYNLTKSNNNFKLPLSRPVNYEESVILPIKIYTLLLNT